MHKVVIERPRWNPGRDKHGRRANLPEELLPRFEGIKRPHLRRKSLTDLLGPLRRWLQSQVGRPWNEVYSEACAVIRPDSIIRAHIKTHLLQFVERHTFMHNGRVCYLNTRRHGGITPIAAGSYGRHNFFVHPVSGVLCELPPPARVRRRQLDREHRNRTVRWLSGDRLLRQINGLWFECTMARFAEHFAKGDSPWSFDLAEKKSICRAMARRIYGNTVYCIAKRQLSRRDLRKFGLNSTIEIAQQRERSGQQIPGGWLTIALRWFRRFSAFAAKSNLQLK